MHRCWLVLVVGGCTTLGVGRTSVGVTASTDGAIGVASSVEVGGGWIDAPKSHPHGVRRDGQDVGLFAGGDITLRGFGIEAGGRSEYVATDGDGEFRIGLRSGVVARSDGPQLAFDAAVGFARARSWAHQRMRYAGIEARLGPALAIDDGLRFAAMRAYVGLTYDWLRTGAGRFDPIDDWLGDPKNHH